MDADVPIPRAIALETVGLIEALDPWFHKTPEARKHLKRLLEQLVWTLRAMSKQDRTMMRLWHARWTVRLADAHHGEPPAKVTEDSLSDSKEGRNP